MTEAPQSYDANDLQALEGLEAVRKRPGMYIGSTDTRGRTHLVYEILDNAVDEALAGYCDRITLTLHPDGSAEVADNGRGIPTDINKKSGLSGVALVMTKLHAGGKFGGSGYKVAGGLHGVGASVTNALSARVDVTVRRDGKVHEINFQRGAIGEFDGPGLNAKFKPGKDIRVTGKYPAKQGTGTTVRFWPDQGIFLPGSVIDGDIVIERAKRTAFLVPGLTIEVRDARDGSIQSHSFKFDGGIVDMVDVIAPDKAINETIQIKGEGTFKENVPLLDEQGHLTPTEVERTVEVNVAFRWGVGYDTTIESFVNIVRTPNGGTHRKGFERATNKALNEAIKNTRGLLKAKDEAPVLDDMLEGMTAVITVNVPEPQFVGQTKDELGTAAVTKIVQQTIEQGLKSWVDGRKTKGEARVVLGKIVDASRVRLTQKQQKDTARRKTALEGASMPSKLVDCRANGVDRSELFIVEGDSALGCFTGDTLVSTVEGNPMSFANLTRDWAAGITHFGYAATVEGSVVVVPLLEPRVTKHATELVEVTLDNDESIRCTPDHLFMLRDGSYSRADALEPGTSLMPLYRKRSDRSTGDRLKDYEQVQSNETMKWDYTHHLSDAWNLASGHDTVGSKQDVRHHVDFNRSNNHPGNIRRMNSGDHIRYHAAHIDANRENVLAGYYIFLDHGGRNMYRNLLKRKWEDPAFREAMTERARTLMNDPEASKSVRDGARLWIENGGRALRSQWTKDQWLNTDLREFVLASNARMFADPEFRRAFDEGFRRWLDTGGREIRRVTMLEQWADPEFRALCSSLSAARHRDPAFREALHGGFQRWWASMPDHERESIVQRLDQAQRDYWASQDARDEARERTLAFFADPTRRAEWSRRSTDQWSNPELRQWRSEATITQFADPAERERQAVAVRTWHQVNPEFGERHSALMQERMSDPNLVAKVQAGRAAYVANVPKAERAAKLVQGRRTAALKRVQTLRDVGDESLPAAYEQHRLMHARTGLRFDRLLAEFDGDISRLRSASETVNHEVVSVTPVRDSVDVYDLTVDDHHNFALEAGVFVHNSARTGRSSEYQALLPIRGKILNVQKATMSDMLKNVEIASIIQSIGAGSGRTFDLSQMRYGRILIMADADTDGSHIRVLLITLFLKLMRPVIEDGRLFAAMPPLHKITTKGRNPETVFTYTEAEMKATVAKLEREGKQVVTPVPRFKGLGEMNASELWETTLNPAVRSVRRITLEDAALAEELVELAMGDKVGPRRDWIIDNADRVDQEAIDA